MKKIKELMKQVIFLVIVAVIGMPEMAYAQKTEDNRRVLFISSYSYAWSTVPLQIQGIEKALGDYVTLDIEGMDTKSVDDSVSRSMFYDHMKYKLQKVPAYDAVIVGDDAALRFAVQWKQELFPDIPIVFEGINDILYAEKVGKDPMITGVIEKISYETNIDFAMQMNPNAKKIVAVVDDTVTGKGEQQQFYQQEALYPQLEFSVLNASEMTWDELVEAVSAVKNDTILLYLIMSEDVDENVYTNDQVCKMFEEYARVPVLRFVQAGIGEGVLGGNVVLHEKSGEIAGRMEEIFGDQAPVPVAAAYDTVEIREGKRAFCISRPIFESSLISVLNSIAAGNETEGSYSEKEKKKFQGKRILAAEDVALNMEVLRRLLEDMGIQVAWAEDGKKAVELFKKSDIHFYDGILMDINMPVMDGYQAARAIRNLGRLDAVTIPIFALTANIMQEDQERILESGMDGYLEKPVNVTVLEETLEKMLKRKKGTCL